MENNNKDIENKIFLSIKEKAKTLSSEEIDKILMDEFKLNNYEDWQIGYAVDRIKKMIKKENNPNESKRVIGISTSVLVGYAIYLIIKALVAGSSHLSTSELIAETVKLQKAKISIPYQTDSVTTVVDITAEPNAIRYHYIFSGVYDNNLINDNWKKDLLLKICLSDDLKTVLNEGINMEFSAVVKDSPQRFFVSITREDCLNYQIPPLTSPDLKPVKVESK